eukprot:6049505-Alexandrium_andersonii.AAC.1
MLHANTGTDRVDCTQGRHERPPWSDEGGGSSHVQQDSTHYLPREAVKGLPQVDGKAGDTRGGHLCCLQLQRVQPCRIERSPTFDPPEHAVISPPKNPLGNVAQAQSRPKAIEV